MCKYALADVYLSRLDFFDQVLESALLIFATELLSVDTKMPIRSSVASDVVLPLRSPQNVFLTRRDSLNVSLTTYQSVQDALGCDDSATRPLRKKSVRYFMSKLLDPLQL